MTGLRAIGYSHKHLAARGGEGTAVNKAKPGLVEMMVSRSKRTIGTGVWRRTQTEGRGGQQSREGKTVGRPGEACTVRAAPAAWLRAGRSPEGALGTGGLRLGGRHGKNPPWGPHSKPHHPLAARLPARPLSCLALNFLASRMGREDSHPRTLAGQGLASLAAAFTQRRGE